MSRKEKPIIGYINVPVRLWSGDIKKLHWHGGGAFWWGADATVDVTPNNNEEFGGMFGGNMAGGFGYSFNRKDEMFYGEIYGEDFYYEIVKLLKQMNPEKLQAIIDEYGRNNEKKKVTKNEVANTNQINEEPQIAREQKVKEDIEETNEIKLNDGWDLRIIDDGGWMKDWKIAKNMPENDYEIIGEPYIKGDDESILSKIPKIPLQLGTNMIWKSGKREGETYKSPKENKENKVKLEISSWVGTSFNAIHIYGNLVYSLCMSGSNIEPDILGTHKMKLTRFITKREIKEHPDNFEESDARTRTDGWYSIKKLIERAKYVFEEAFTNEWILDIDEDELIKEWGG
jgi:hypothetical protein